MAANTLKSYRATTTIDTSGTASGQPVQATTTIKAEYTSNPPASHLSVSSTSNGQPTGTPFELYDVNSTEYVNYQGSWSTVPTGSASSSIDLLSGDAVLKNTCSAWTNAGTTDVSGVKATEYKLNGNAALSCPGLKTSFGNGATITKASGDVFLAVDGNYIVKMEITLEGTNLQLISTASNGTPTTMDKGTEAITYVLSDVNQSFTIQLPAAAQKAANPSSALPSDIPAPADAKLTGNFGGYIILSTGDTVQQATDFYKSAMVKDGWTAGAVTQTAVGTDLEFTKGSQAADIIIGSNPATPGATTININVRNPGG